MADHKLIERVRFGDDTAFHELIEKYYREIQLFILQTGLPVDYLSSAVKKTFVQANRSVTSFEGTSVSAWLYRLARDTASAYKNNRQSRIPETNVEDAVKARVAEAVESLSMLPEKYRIPFLLHHFHGQSFQEITEILSTDEETAKTAVHEAERQLEEVTDSVDEKVKEVKARYHQLPDIVAAEDIWDHLNKVKKKRKTKVGWFIGIGGTLSALSLGIFLLLSQSVLLPEKSDTEQEEPVNEGTQEEETDSEDQDKPEKNPNEATPERDPKKDITFLIEGMEETQTFQLLSEPGLSFSTYIPEFFTVEAADDKAEVFAAFTPEQEPTEEPVWMFQEYADTPIEDIIDQITSEYQEQGYELVEENEEEELKYGAYAAVYQDNENNPLSVILLTNGETVVKWEKDHPPEMADGLAARVQVAAEEWEWLTVKDE